MDIEKQREIAEPSRRKVLGIIGGLGIAAVAASCGDDGGTTTAANSTTTAASSGATTTAASNATTTAANTAATTTAASAGTAVTSCAKIPEETAGPYPGDGTNGPNVLTQSGVVRSDIRSSVGTSTTTAKGVALTVVLTILDKSTCKPISGAAVYLWHCDQGGNYSMYSQGVTNENYLRGVQAADSNGVVTFKSIYPGTYSGRWPHIHFEVFDSLSVATVGTKKRATSQIAMPEDSAKATYTVSGYEQSVKNLAQITLKTDNVFSDGVTLQTPTVSGDATNGFTIKMNVAV